ncbi:MAG TPA: hypothetical protein VIM73_14870, partial [Polyangiaceae bacterium]
MIPRIVLGLLTRLVSMQARRPLWFIGLAIVSLVPAWLLARNLELRTGFGELLPENQPSVVELRRAADRLPSMSTLAITAESK